MTDQRTNNCTLCILLPLILGVASFIALYWFAKDSKAEYIQNDLSLKSNQLLKDNQIGNVIVNVDGRDAILTGTVTSQVRSDEIEQIIASMSGIRVVNNQLVVAKVEKAPAEPKIVMTPKVEPLPKFEPESEPEPKPALETTKKEVVQELLQTLDLSGITFLFGSNEITAEGQQVLNEVINVLSEHPEFDVAVEGHTDSVGDDELNLYLSQQRAQSVLNYLSNNGINSERLTATGFGESSPIAANDSAEGRALNRRIEFSVSRKN